MKKEDFKKQFEDSTYSLAKALHHVNIAKQYFEDVRFSTGKEVKSVFNQYIIKCDWIIRDVRDRLTEESRQAIANELEDSLSFDAIIDKLVHMDTEQRNFIEDLMDSMIKGEEVKIVQ